MSDNYIKILYKTPAGSVWETRKEAFIAHRIESSNVYVESYKLEALVKAVCTPAADEELQK